MLVSVIVPAYNEERLLGITLVSIQSAAAAFSVRGWTWELIVCDNNSSDDTAEVARRAGATVVFEPVNQIGRARNTGARAASGDWLLFIDADSNPDKALFADVAEAIHSGFCIAGGTVLRMETDRGFAIAATRFWNRLSRTFRLLAGSFIFCEAAAFRAIGGFDETLFAGEEIDLTKRLKRYARPLKKKIVILSRHPLLTSARKAHLYTLWEHFAFLGRAIFTGTRSLRKREHCAPWYDGRR